MSKLMSVLRKAGLVEAESGAKAMPPPPAADLGGLEKYANLDAEQASSASKKAGFEEGVALDEIFSQLGVVAANFSAERLQKLLTGLMQLDPATRQTAVLAMDAADDSWDMDSVLADARAKVAALGQYQESIRTEVATLVASNTQKSSSSENVRDGAVKEFREQIEALENKISQTMQNCATDTARLHAESESYKASLQREIKRLKEKASEYTVLVTTFGGAAVSKS